MSEYQDHIARWNAQAVMRLEPETEFPPPRVVPKEYRKFRDLGKILGLILVELKSADYAYEDIRAFHAPSECMDIVRKGIENRVYETLKRNAITGPELRAAVAQRTPTSQTTAAIAGEAERIWDEKSKHDHFAGVSIARIASQALFGGNDNAAWTPPAAALLMILEIAGNGMAYDQAVVDDDRRQAMEERLARHASKNQMN